MKNSNSKQELARIISESGGWRDGAESAAQCKSDNAVSFYCDIPDRDGDCWRGEHLDGCDIGQDRLIANWHQSCLSRAEYFHLYPAPDADGWIEWGGGECPVGDDSIVDVMFCNGRVGIGLSPLPAGGAGREGWRLINGRSDIIAYRLHKPNAVKPTDFGAIGDDETNLAVKEGRESMEYQPTIEQLAADYRNAKDYAERKQKEAGDAKADVDEKLRVLELAGEALGLLVSPITARQEPELVITDWRDLQAGDVISVSGRWWGPDSEYTVDENDGSRDAPIRVGDYWAFIGECSFKFIRRP